MILEFYKNPKGWVGISEDGGDDRLYFIDKHNEFQVRNGGLYEINLDTANIYQPINKRYCFIRSGLEYIESISYAEAINLGCDIQIPTDQYVYKSGQIIYRVEDEGDGRFVLLQKKNGNVLEVEIPWSIMCVFNVARTEEKFDATDLFRDAMFDKTADIDLSDLVQLISETVFVYTKSLYLLGRGVILIGGSKYYNNDPEYYIFKDRWHRVNCNICPSEYSSQPNMIKMVQDFASAHLIAINTTVEHTICKRLYDGELLEIRTYIPKVSNPLVCKMFNYEHFSEDVYERHKDEVKSSCEAMVEQGRRLIKNGLSIDNAYLCSYKRFFAKNREG